MAKNEIEMQDSDTDKQTEAAKQTKSATTAIIAGLLVIAVGFASYKYFNKAGNPELGGGTNTNTNVQTEETNEPVQNPDEEVQKNEVINQPTVNPQSAKAQIVKPVELKPVSTVPVAEKVWVANDYKAGDITGSKYTVKAGDTLWEIAEARYGSGSAYTKIIAANSSSIGHLPGDGQALIFSGQTLVLP